MAKITLYTRIQPGEPNAGKLVRSTTAAHPIPEQGVGWDGSRRVKTSGYWLRYRGEFTALGHDWSQALKEFYSCHEKAAKKEPLNLGVPARILHAPESTNQTPFTAEADRYLQARKSGLRPLRPSTLASIEHEMRWFVRWANANGLSSVKEMTMERALHYLRTDRVSLSLSSRNKAARIIGSFYRFIVGTNLFNSWDFEQAPAKEPSAYAEDELSRLLSLRQGRRAFWLCLAYTGLRRNEFANLEWCDLDLSRGILFVRSHPRRKQWVKDREARQIPLHPTLLRYLQYRQNRVPHGPHDLVFFSAGAKPKMLAFYLQEDARRAGIENARLHRFRATFASYCILRANIDPTIVMSWLGHSNYSTTVRYYLSQQSASSTRLKESLRRAFSAPEMVRIQV